MAIASYSTLRIVAGQVIFMPDIEPLELVSQLSGCVRFSDYLYLRPAGFVLIVGEADRRVMTGKGVQARRSPLLLVWVRRLEVHGVDRIIYRLFFIGVRHELLPNMLRYK